LEPNPDNDLEVDTGRMYRLKVHDAEPAVPESVAVYVCVPEALGVPEATKTTSCVPVVAKVPEAENVTPATELVKIV
jgi:hypothetical protein